MPIQCVANEPVKASFIRCSKLAPEKADQSFTEEEENVFAIRRSKGFPQSWKQEEPPR
jgi:hypothetical protein